MSADFEKRLEKIEKDIRSIKDMLESISGKLNVFFDSHAEEKILSAHEVADLINLDVEEIYALCRRKEIPFFKMGKPLKFRQSEILAWIKNRGKENIGSVDDMVSRYLQKKPLKG